MTTQKPKGRRLASALACCIFCVSAAAGAAEKVATPNTPDLPAPDTARITQIYRDARTIDDIVRANDFVKGEVSKAGAMRGYLSKLHNAIALSCDAAGQLHTPLIESIAAKTGALGVSLADIDARMVNSLAQQKKAAAAVQGSYRSAQDAKTYEGRYAEFKIASVNAQEIAKSVDRLSANIKSVAASCRPSTIPPLFETKADVRASEDPRQPPQQQPQTAQRATVPTPLPPPAPSAAQSQQVQNAAPRQRRKDGYQLYYGYDFRYR